MVIAKAVCGMCGADNCGIDVYLDDGRIVDVKGMREYPVNRGRLCPQARASIEQTYDPNRLRYPLKREGGSWRRIAWDEALDVIADKLGAVKATDGAQALAVYQGRALLQFIKDGWVHRFMNVYGTPNFVRNEHMCAVPVAIGEKLTFGSTTLYYGYDPEHVRCVVLWGSNPATSHIPTTWHDLVEARKRNAKLIVIDPRQTPPASKADIYAPVRPGTDLALALGLIHVIIAEKLYDAAFVACWTTGFDALSERVAAYTPDRVEAITGVPAADIRRIAEVYATTKPAYLEAGNALEHHSNSGQTIRAVMILRAITGNLDMPGGHLFTEKVPLRDVTLREKRPAGLRPIGAEQYPMFVEMDEFVPGDALIASLIEGKPYPVRAMIMGGGNPAISWPNSRRVEEALSRLDLLVVLDLYMTSTARLADIVLPAADPFERTQLITWSGFFGAENPTSYVMLRRPIVDPGERRSDWWFWNNLARRMGYATYFPWADAEEAIDFQIEPLGITVEDLRASPSGMYYGSRPQYRRYEMEGFRTPTGKVELYSQTLATYGYDPLPDYTEPGESLVSQPALAERFPLVLDTGRSSAVYTGSRHRNLSSLRRMEPEPLAEIHPATAAAYHICDGERVAVETLRGRIELTASVTEKIRPGVVSVPKGWAEANANRLTDHEHCDPILACPPLRAALCRVEAKSGS